MQPDGPDPVPRRHEVEITADAGGSNGPRVRAWKWQLARLAAETGSDITVCHYSPGTRKWNEIEHRLFTFISMNWRGRALTEIRIIVELIAATKTTTGLTVQCAYNPSWYPTGENIGIDPFAASTGWWREGGDSRDAPGTRGLR